MVAVIPKVRIAPSGPLAEEADGGELAPPLNTMSGAYFRLADDHGAPNGGYSLARIGPVGGAAQHVPSAWLYKGAVPVGDGGLNAANRSPFMAVDADSADMSLGIGKWVVEATLTVGYESSAPTGPTDAGALSCVFSFLNSDGETVGDPSNVTKSIIPAQGSGGVGIVRTTVVRGVLEITQSMIDANGGAPISSVQLFMTREDSTDQGNYDTSAGWLQFSTESTLSIKRYR